MRTWMGVIGRLLAGLLGVSVAGGMMGAFAASAHPTSDEDRIEPVDIEPLPPDPAAASPVEVAGEHMEAHRINIELTPSGSALITETIDYDFASPTRRGIFRDFTVRQAIDEETDRVYPVDIIDISSETAPDQWTTDSDDPVLRIRVGDPERFAPRTASYTLTYEVEGAVDIYRDNPQVADHDEFYWNVTGDGWDIIRNNVVVTVTAPEGAEQVFCFAGEYGDPTQCSDASIGGGGASFSQGALFPNEGLTIAAWYPVGTFPGAEPVIEEGWTAEKTFGVSAPLAAGIGGMSLVGMALVGALTWLVGRDRQGSSLAVDAAFSTETTGGSRVRPFHAKNVPVEFVPPDDLRPGHFGVLIDEIADDRDVIAGIVDLAVRGYLIIEDNGADDTDIDMKIIRTEKPADVLSRHENELIRDLCGSSGSLHLKGPNKRMATAITNGRRRLYRDMADEGWFGQDPFVNRSTWTTAGVILAGAGVLLFTILVFIGRWAFAAVPVMLAGVVLVAAARLMPARTPRGTGLLRRARGFEIFLTDSEAARARFAEDNSILTKYLPYVIAIGETKRWAKTFEGLQAPDQPDWYRSNRPFHTHHFIYMGNHMSRSATPPPTPSSARGGANSGGGFGGGAFGGGGFSGGGGFGGGGGSW